MESYREDGKVRQRVLAYVGERTTLRTALVYWQEQVKPGEDAPARKHARGIVNKIKFSP